ncbi:unnamed protein product [Dovyalis caffra]|uniref:F-box domain-containing protein n=1 Tax=Dovyalis caffra TaxID=77055 RepID=A0AAV1R0C5_9ROSI|nr:unnamed protein product [Dovyalis caffra]
MSKRIKASILIPGDIWFDVLARLPAKSLMRFKCVCKLWGSFIKDPFFIQLHRSHSKSRHGNTVISYTDLCSSTQYFYFANTEGNPDPCKGTLSMPEYRCISEIVNGLICLIGPHNVSICNLSTHEIMTLPDAIPERENFSRECHACFLFGSDSLAQIFKVLRVRTVVTRNRYGYKSSRKTCDIFRLGVTSSRTSWKRIKAHPHRFPSRMRPASGEYRLHADSVCANGVIYWLQHANWQGQFDIGAFDVSEEKFLSAIPVPEDGPSSHDVEYLLQIGGNLALVNQQPRSQSRSKIEMWLLEGYGQNKLWTKKEILLQQNHLWSRMLPIGNIHTGEILFIPEHFFSNSLKLTYYDQKTESYRENEKTVSTKEGIFSIITKQYCPNGAYFLKEEWTPYYQTGKGMKLIRFFTTDGLENILPLRKDN